MTNEMTDRQDALASRITDYVDARPGRDFNASQLARVAGCDTHEAHSLLRWLIANNMIMPCGRGGSWTRFRARRFGEIPSSTVRSPAK